VNMLPYLYMKKILIATILLLGVTTVPIYAQEEESIPDEQIEMEVQEKDLSDQESVEKETTSSKEEVKVTQENSIGFWSILFATITPALLIVVAYLLIKMANK